MAWENLSAEVADIFAELQERPDDVSIGWVCRQDLRTDARSGVMPAEVREHLARHARENPDAARRAGARFRKRHKARIALWQRNYRSTPEYRAYKRKTQAAWRKRRAEQTRAARLHARMMLRAMEIMGWGVE